MSARIVGVQVGFNRIIFWFVVLVSLGIWPALTNRQPFFYADTTSYVRGADIAIAKVFGSRFATYWAKDQRRTFDLQTPVPNPEAPMAAEKSSQRVVLAGRSIIYGALLYFGEVFGGMWFSVIVQSLIVTYLIFVFTVRILGLNFNYFLACCFFVCLATPLPFFVSFLMPDVFAGILILGFAILATGWDRLSRVERAITSAILLFAVLSHTTHLLLLLGLTALTVIYVLLAARARWINLRRVTAVAAACVVLALLWELAFSFGVSRAFGSAPVRPPFVTAKLVSMLGQPVMAKFCASNAYVVCRFQDRFPVDAETFLWSEDQHTGVFNVADVQTKRQLGAEESRIALAIIPANFGHLAARVSLDALRQLIQFRLDEFAYPPTGMGFFENRMPRHEFDKLNSTFAARSDAYVIFGRTVVYFTAIVGALVTALLLYGMPRHGTVANEKEREKRPAWCASTCTLLAGIVLNAIICGGVGAVNNRYQARVVWLIQLSAVSGICVAASGRKFAIFGNPEIPKYAPAHNVTRYEPRSE
jgi:hypothetical protein